MDTCVPISDDPRYRALVQSLQTGEPVYVGDGYVLNVREVDPRWNSSSNNEDE